MQRGWFQPTSLVSFVALALALSSAARADVFNLDEFAVTKGTTQIFDDTFNRNATFAGGSGTLFNSGTTFSDTSTANYFVKGTITETTNNNGQAVLDTSKGVLISLPDPFIPVTQNVQAFLETGSTGSHSLTQSTAYSEIGLFDLAVPTVQLGTYDIALSSQTVGVPGRELELRVRETATGPILQFAWLDFVGHSFTQIAEIPITAADLANPQLELELSQNTAGSNVITASYAFGTGNTLATFNGTLASLGSTDSATVVYATNLFVLPGFNAFDPAVPEPSTWVMVLAGFASLGLLARRGRRAPASV